MPPPTIIPQHLYATRHRAVVTDADSSDAEIDSQSEDFSGEYARSSWADLEISEDSKLSTNRGRRRDELEITNASWPRTRPPKAVQN